MIAFLPLILGLLTMFTDSALRALSALFPTELTETKIQLKSLVRDHPDLSTCDGLYDETFLEIIRSYPDYTQAQFERLFSALRQAIETTNDLYEQFSDIPRLASVILMRRINYLENLTFLKEICTRDLTELALDIDKAIFSVKAYKVRLKADYNALMQRVEASRSLLIFRHYHVDANEPSPPSVQRCRDLLTNAEVIPKAAMPDFMEDHTDKSPLIYNK